MKHLYIYITLLIICLSCKFEKYNNCTPIQLSDFHDPIKIEGKLFNLNEIMKPTSLFIEDSILILKEYMNDYILHKYNIKTKEKIGSCISFGNGPNEFLYLHKIQLLKDLFWLSDGQKGFISAYKKGDILYTDSTAINAIRSLIFPDNFNNILTLPDNRFVATVPNSNHKRLSIYNNNGKLIETKGEFPNYGEKLSPFEEIEGFSCSMIISPKEDGIFLFYKQTDLIELYDLNGNLKTRLQGPDFFFPKIKQTNQNDVIHVNSISGESRDGYFSPVSVNGQVYVLYSGAYFDRKNPQYLMSNLFVFDNNGRPLKRYILDQPIFTFTIDKSTNKLYGISDNPEFHIVEFQL